MDINANTTKQWTGLLFCWTGIYYRILHRFRPPEFPDPDSETQNAAFSWKICETVCDNCNFCKYITIWKGYYSIEGESLKKT